VYALCNSTVMLEISSVVYDEAKLLSKTRTELQTPIPRNSFGAEPDAFPRRATIENS
jgi:hypothetical protein